MKVFLDGRVTLLEGDCREQIKTIPDNSLDSCVCDPPYALVSIVKRFGKAGAAPAQFGSDGRYARASAGFMGQSWDTGEVAFDPEFWFEVLRVLKPGGYLIAMGGTRTYHRLAVAVEDAGFEIRDSILELMASDTAVIRFMETLDAEQRAAFVKCIEDSQFGGMLAWVYGSGFPKSHDLAKAIDKHLGAQGGHVATGDAVRRMIPDADQNKQGWEKNNGREYVPGEYVPATPEALQWDGWGTALKPAWEPIVLARKPLIGTVVDNVLALGTGALNIGASRVGDDVLPEQRAGQAQLGTFERTDMVTPERVGRFPANVIHDGSEEVIEAFPETESGTFSGHRNEPKTKNTFGKFDLRDEQGHVGDSGSAARFYYSSKADAHDRIGSKHPTVKPVDLMQYLIRLVTPKGGTVLDPFAGTGSTGEAAFREGMKAILIEREPKYQEDIARRMELVEKPTKRAAVAAGKGKLMGAEGTPLFGDA